MFNATLNAWTHVKEVPPEEHFSWLIVLAIVFAILALGAAAFLIATGRLPFGVG
jgi:hypothetical protein